VTVGMGKELKSEKKMVGRGETVGKVKEGWGVKGAGGAVWFGGGLGM